MRAQSKAMSLLESWTNIGVGLGLQMAANFVLLPVIFAVPMNAHAQWGVVIFAAIMTVLSLVRGYGLRRVFERLRQRGTPPDFLPIIEEIARERFRQIDGEGFTLAHDDLQCRGEIAAGAAAYAFAASLGPDRRRAALAAFAADYFARPGDTPWTLRTLWPLMPHQFKPTNARRDLIKAGAMIVAEIGRLDRAANQKSGR